MYGDQPGYVRATSSRGGFIVVRARSQIHEISTSDVRGLARVCPGNIKSRWIYRGQSEAPSQRNIHLVYGAILILPFFDVISTLLIGRLGEFQNRCKVEVDIRRSLKKVSDHPTIHVDFTSIKTSSLVHGKSTWIVQG